MGHFLTGKAVCISRLLEVFAKFCETLHNFNSAAAKVNNCALCGKSMKFAMMVGIGLINNLRPGPTLGVAYLGAEPHLHKRGGL